MYVREDHRGTGLADALVEAVIDHAIGLVEQLKLTVNAENPRAIALYERHGFRTVGRIPRSIRVGDRTYDELMMIRAVSAHGLDVDPRPSPRAPRASSGRKRDL